MDSTLTSIATYLDPKNITPTLVSFGWKILSAVLVLVIGMSIIKLVTTLLRRALKRAVSDTTVRYYSLSATKILLWTVLVLILLGVFGIQTTSLVAVLGAAGLAIGLALQGSLSNFAAGFMLLLFRPFKAGDVVEVSGVTGSVIEIGIFTTIIDTPDNIRAFVPNSAIFSGVIRNRSVNEYIRLEVKITLAKGTDISRAQEIINRTLATNDLVMEVPRPEVQVIEDPTEGITIAIRPCSRLRNADTLRSTLNKEMREEFHRANIDVIK